MADTHANSHPDEPLEADVSLSHVAVIIYF